MNASNNQRTPFPPELAESLATRFGKRFSQGESIRLQHGRDESVHQPQPPQGVVLVENTDEIVLTVKLCAEHGVPIMEQPALARALHRHAEVGDEVPVTLYNAVAQVLAYVYQLKHLSPGMTLHEPGLIDIPAGLDPLEQAS